VIAQQNDDEVLAAELDAFVGQAQQPSFESDAAAAGWLDAFQRQATGALDAVTPEQGFVSGFGSGFIGTAGTMARATRLPEELVMNTLGALGLDESSQKVVRAAVELMPGTQGLRMIQRQGEKAQQVAGELAQGRPTFRGSVGQAAGSAIAMAPASVVGGVGAAGAVGAALEAESALETGEALGASPGQKLGGMAAGAALGAIEGGFGPEKELAKLGKVLRGGSSEVRQRVAASILGAMVKSGAEEAGEEFVQGMGEEAIAQFIYEDPERNGRALAEWLSTSASVALDQGLPAAIVGAVLGGLARTGQLQRMAEVGKAVRPDAPLTDFGQIAKEQAGERTPGEVGPEWEQLRASLEKQNRTPVRYVESGENAQASRVQDLAKKLGLEVQFVEAMPKDVKPAAPPSQPPVVGQVGFPEDVTQGVLSDTSRTPPASGAIEPASAPPQMPTEPTMFGPEERRSKGVRGDVVTPKVVQPNLLDIQKGDIKGQRSMLDDPEVAQGVKAKSEAAAGVTEEPRKWTRSEARNDLQLKDSNIKIAGKRKRVGLYVTYGDNLKWFGEVYTGDGGPLKSDRIGDLWRINGELHVVDTEYGVIQKISRPIDAKEVAKSGTFSPTVSGSFKEQRWRWVGKPPVVAETQPAKPAARTMADRIKARHADASNGRLGFRAWVRAMGGLNIQKSGDLGGELRDLRESGNENSFGLGPLVRGEKSSIGVSLDGVLEAAMERGYLPQGSGVREVLELLDSDFTPEKADIDAQKFMAEEAKALEDQAKAAGYASFEDYQAKQDEIDAQARREGWDPDAPVTERTDDDTDVPFAAQRGPGLRYPAAYLGGRVAIDINNTSPVKLLFHEGLHHLAAANPKGFDTLLRAMTDLKPEQIAAARRAYEAAFGENAPKGTALDEEAAAVFSEDMAGLLEQAFNDPAKLARVFADRNVFQVVRDWIARLAKTFGGSMQTTIEKRLAEVEASDSAEVGLALLWKETADMAAWGDATDEERAKFAAAYHGTPFDFDRFDMSKVGTGEGAQAYGHGLYFAGNKDIAEHYRKKLSAPARSLDQKAREVYDQYDDPTDAEAAFMSRPDFSESERTLLQSLKSDGWLGFDFPHQAVRAALGDKLDNFDPSPETRAAVDAVKSERRGKLYEVELAPQEDEYLLWDKPLSEQSEKVKAALLNRWPKWVKREMDESNPLGGMFYEDVSVEFRSQKAASAALHAAGIRGIKYLDGSSRSKGEGDYNYVLFDDKDVSIKAKFAAAYHGTPFDFDRFDMSKVGTGEGAQAYGHGLYFAGNKDIAEHYRKKLSAPARSLDQKAREVYDQYDDPTDAEAAFMSRPDFSESERTLLQSLKSDGWLGFDFPHQAVRAALGDKLDNFDPSPETRAAVDAVKSERRGKLYEVELAPQEDEYLLWDKPLSEQSEKVKAALLNRWPKWVKREMDESNPLGGMFYEDVSVEFRSQKAASAALHAAGIRGIKYLDGSSRSKGEGDYNYVLFDDKDVSIKAKFAVDRSQTETPEFKRWFGDSKVVDEGGKPLAVYHGTDAAIERFDNSKLGSATGAKSARVGHWFVDRQDVAVGYANHAALEATVRRAVERADALEAKAQRSGKSSDWDAHTAAVDAYEAVQREMDAERNRGQNVVPAYLSIQNPATFDAGGESFMDQQDEINAFLRAAKRDGHDGAILTNLDDDPGFNGRVGTHYVAFKPEQIKSATGNRGTFDPANPDIRFAVDRNSPGDDGQAITTVFQGALQRRSDGWFWRSGKPAPNVRDDTPSQSYNFRVSLRSGGKFVEVPLSRKMDPDLAWVFESQRLGRYITGVDNDREVSRQERSGEEYPTLSAQPVFEDGDIPGISEPGIALRKTRDATKARAVYVPIADWDLWSNGTVTGALWNKADEPEILLQAKLEGWSPPARFAVSPEDRARMPVRLESPASKIDPTSAPDVVAALAKAIEAAGGQTPIRVGRMGRRSKTAAGFFKVGPEVIRLKTANDIPTAAHETAHALEKHVYGWPKGGPWKNPLVDIATQKELTTLGRKLYGDTKPAGGYKREGFAEYVRLYVSDPGSLPDAAPNFHKWFTEAFLPSQPEIAKQLDKARDLTTRWREQGAVARARASVIDPASLGERWKRAKEKLRYTRIASTMWESGEAIKEAESAAAARKDLTADQKPYTTFDELRLTHDAKVAYMVEKGMIDFNANVVGGPLTDIRPLIKGKYNDFLVFLWAKRALALRASGRNAGISIEDAAQIVEELGSEKFQLAASKLYAWNEGVLDYISQASPHFARVVARIRASDPGSYIPLQREMDDVDRRWGGGVSDGGSPLKRLKGSGRRIKDPLQTVLARSRKLVLAAHQRKVLDQVVALHRIEGMGKWVEEIPPSKVPLVKQSLGDVLEKIEQKVDPLGEGVPDLDALREQFFDMLDLSMTEFGDKQQPDSKDPIIPYWEDGEVRWFQVNPDLYRALSTMENYRLPGMVGAVAGGMTRTFRAGTTGLRAAFGMVRNPIRDLPTLYLNSRANRNGAALLGTWAHEMGKSFVSAASGGAVTDEWADLAQRLGVTMAQPLGQDISPTKRAARRLSQGVVVRTLDPRNWFDWYREFIQFPEGATRTTEIRAIAREIGWKPGEPMTREQAQRLTLVGKKVTTDFTASGNFARVMNQIIPFFNSAIQGPRSTIQAAREHPLRYMLRGAAITASTVALWLQNKDEDWWKEISDEEKFSSWHFEIEHDGKTEIVRIPRPYEIGGVFAALPEAMLEAWYNEDPDAAEHWAREFVSITTPDITPAAAKPVIEWLANYDFFRQRPIVPRSEENKPEAEQAGPFTSRLARVLGEWTDKSPRKIDHTINAIFGPVAGDVVTALGLGAEARAAKGELAETPVVGTLFRRGGPLISRPKSVDALYDAYSAALKVQASDKVDETREQREARLMLQDAIQAVGALSYIRWESPKQEVREAAYQEMVKIARDAQTAAKDGSARAGLYDRASKMAKREKERLKRELEGSKGN